MTLSGETIDYGPCAFMDDYAPGTVFSSIDQTGAMPMATAGHWAMEPGAPGRGATAPDRQRVRPRGGHGDQRFCAAMWLATTRPGCAACAASLGLWRRRRATRRLARGLLSALEGQAADWTLTFRALSAALRGDAGAFTARFAAPERALAWLETWRARQARESGDPARRAAAMDRANPAVIPRNHKVEEALTAAVAGDLDPFEALLAAVSDPYADPAGARVLCAAATLGLFGRVQDLLRHLRVRTCRWLPRSGRSHGWPRPERPILVSQAAHQGQPRARGRHAPLRPASPRAMGATGRRA